MVTSSMILAQVFSLIWVALMPQVITVRRKAPSAASYYTPLHIQDGIGTTGMQVGQGVASLATLTTANLDTTAGDDLLVFAYCTTDSITLSVGDTQTNSYIPLISNASGNPGEFSLWITKNIPGGSSQPTVTVTASGTCAELYGTVIEMKYLDSLDSGPGTNSGLTSSAVSVSTNKSLLIGILTGGDGGTNAAAGTGFTISGVNNRGSHESGIEYRIVDPSSGSYTASFTSATGTVYTSIVAIKPRTM